MIEFSTEFVPPSKVENNISVTQKNLLIDIRKVDFDAIFSEFVFNKNSEGNLFTIALITYGKCFKKKTDLTLTWRLLPTQSDHHK